MNVWLWTLLSIPLLMRSITHKVLTVTTHLDHHMCVWKSWASCLCMPLAHFHSRHECFMLPVVIMRIKLKPYSCDALTFKMWFDFWRSHHFYGCHWHSSNKASVNVNFWFNQRYSGFTIHHICARSLFCQSSERRLQKTNMSKTFESVI